MIATTGIDTGVSDTIAPRAAEVGPPARDRTAESDHQGRADRRHVFSVDPSTGALSATSLTSDTWFDHRGEVIKTAEPGGLITKEAHEGVGRVPVVYTTGGGLRDNFPIAILQQNARPCRTGLRLPCLFLS